MGLTWLIFNGRSRPVAICILFQLSYLIHLLRLLRLLQFMHVFCVVLLQSGMDITHTNRKRAPNWNTSKTCQFFPLLLPLPYHDGALSSSVDLIFYVIEATRGEDEVRMRAAQCTRRHVFHLLLL